MGAAHGEVEEAPVPGEVPGGSQSDVASRPRLRVRAARLLARARDGLDAALRGDASERLSSSSRSSATSTGSVWRQLIQQ